MHVVREGELIGAAVWLCASSATSQKGLTNTASRTSSFSAKSEEEVAVSTNKYVHVHLGMNLHQLK